MNSYICNRDGNALSYRTHEFRPGGQLFCWQCEQRTKNGLALLPERVEISVEDIRAQASAAAQSAEEKREKRRVRDAARKREQTKRQQSGEWINHLALIRPRPRNAEYVRAYWQKRAVQLGLPDVA